MAYRDSTTASGNSTTPSVAVPAGVVASDIVLLVCSIDNLSVSFDAPDWPSGFTELAEANLTLDGHSAAVGWKRLTGSDSGNYTFGTLEGAGDWICQALALSGRHGTDPPVISTPAINNNPNTSPVTVTANGVTALAGDDLMWISAPDVASINIGNGHAAPTDFIEAEDSENAWTNLSIAYRENVSAGATGDVSGTFTLSSGESGWAAFLVRVPAAQVPPSTIPLFARRMR